MVDKIIEYVNEMEKQECFSYRYDEHHPHDGCHHVFRNIGLCADAELHRFENPSVNGGTVKCSAIWKDGFEYGWHYADREKDMIEWWQDRGYRLALK